jgi:hypothetical protein
MTGRRASKPWRILGWEPTISLKDMDRHNEADLICYRTRMRG